MTYLFIHLFEKDAECITGKNIEENIKLNI